MNYRHTIIILTALFIAAIPGTELIKVFQESVSKRTVIPVSDVIDFDVINVSEQGDAKVLDDTTIVMAEDSIFANISFATTSLKVTRDGESVDLTETSTLFPGDHIETCARSFAVVDFHPAGSMILFPASMVVINKDGTLLDLKSAEILFENESGISSFPATLRCFDDFMYHHQDYYPVSFGIHCRGESGMILTAKSGSAWWSCKGAPCEVPEGSGLMGRVTTANYSSVTLPPKPVITTAYVVPDLVPEVLDSKEVNGIGQKSGYTATIMWNPVPMADQYVVHIARIKGGDMIHQVMTLHHRNQFTAQLPGSGRYFARVMAVDFYGVSGTWSELLAFTADPRSDDVLPDTETIRDVPVENQDIPREESSANASFLIKR